METALREDDEDMTVLRLCMRPEENLREYRRRVPWKGEFRYFRSDNVVCIEHHGRQTPRVRGYSLSATAMSNAGAFACR
jgi:hypothetical protein